ncbi:MAG: hypothetical protein JRJ27_09735 [Deltaproteobacteria bacterium]|nr:hypothetical protein [Deltaproteobacteria bacterium]
MYRMKPFIVCMAVIFLIACAGQQVRNSSQPIDPGKETTDENIAEQWESEEQQSRMFSDRSLHIISEVLIAALVVTEICLFWYLVDKHYDSKDPFLWISPIWPLWY